MKAQFLAIVQLLNQTFHIARFKIKVVGQLGRKSIIIQTTNYFITSTILTHPVTKFGLAEDSADLCTSMMELKVTDAMGQDVTQH